MQLGIYTHSKTGNLYRVIGVAKHTETKEEFVVYEAMYDKPAGKLWIRPKEMFLEDVVLDGKRVKRFVYLRETL